MVFSSPTFLLMFLPLVLLLYFLVPKNFKNLILSIASLYFYAFGEKFLVILIFLSTLINYYAALLIEKRNDKRGLILAIVFNFASLFFFKYINFTFDNFNNLLNLFNVNSSFLRDFPKIALPIGISFYTFQTMSYVVDVHRKDVKASKNFINFLAYVTMFPQLVAGPIVRYIDIEKQLRERTHSVDKFNLGLERFILGLSKKMIIANTFALIADKIFANNATDLSTSLAWIGIISYSFQIYYDFSGYSDMAIGLGKMFGFDFLENFNYPYISNSIKEFWRRWHISLSTWFRDYLYIPLGGNRNGKYGTYKNLFIVFFITGLWHGASWNFIVWGLFHGVFLIIERLGFEKILLKLWKPFQHIYTLVIVIIGWVFFRSENLTYALAYLNKMFIPSKGNPEICNPIYYFNINNEFYIALLIAVLFSMPIFIRLDNLFKTKTLVYARPLFMFTLLFFCVIYVAASAYNPFIYFKF
jgi:alginate O-acetyltransferase complex protein AlgI